MVKKVVKKTITETTDDDGSKKTVVKEHAPKETPTKKKPAAHRTHSTKTASHKSHDDSKKKMTAKEREELLIQNFVGLQHAMTNMSIKFGTLSDNISKLLSVFEEAAKGFVVGDKGDDKDMLNKIDSLLDQNKTIAKGLVLMEERVRTRVENAKEAEKTIGEAEHSGKPVNRGESHRPPMMNRRPSMGEGRPPVMEGSPSMMEGSSDQSQGPQSFGTNSSSRPKPLPRI